MINYSLYSWRKSLFILRHTSLVGINEVFVILLYSHKLNASMKYIWFFWPLYEQFVLFLAPKISNRFFFLPPLSPALSPH